MTLGCELCAPNITLWEYKPFDPKVVVPSATRARKKGELSDVYSRGLHCLRVARCGALSQKSPRNFPRFALSGGRPSGTFFISLVSVIE
jgi:hypothetical protein